MGKISKSTLNKVLLRTQGCQFAHNYERMQSLSLTYCFAPVLEELYKDAPKEERVNAMKRHLEYFNTHPLAIPFILGITAALEESTDEDQKDTVVGIKTSLMGPFAGLGDSLLNLTWFPIAGSIGASMCVDNGSIVGPLVMFLLINLLYWPLKYFGLHKGYEMGMELVEKAGVQVFDRLVPCQRPGRHGHRRPGRHDRQAQARRGAPPSARATRWCSRISSTRSCPLRCRPADLHLLSPAQEGPGQ